MGVSESADKTQTWANVSMNEMYKENETMRASAHSVNVLVGVQLVKRHGSGEVRCNVVISVVIGVHVLL